MGGQVARLGDSIIIVLKLIDAEKQRVLASVKYKAPADEGTYDEAVESAVLQLFGIEAAPGVSAGASVNDTSALLRSLISSTDYTRYLEFKKLTSSDSTLHGWIDVQNNESNLLFVGELVSGLAMLLSVGEVTEGFDPRIADGPPLIFTLGALSLVAMLIVDYMDIGAVSVMGI